VAKIRSTAKLTSQNQLTLPIAVRKALDLSPGAEVEFVVDGDRVTVHSTNHADLIVAAVLAKIEADISQNPDQLVAIEADDELDAILATVRL
jgi:AbrB family looped-hinge helix DNA binding protein